MGLAQSKQGLTCNRSKKTLPKITSLKAALKLMKPAAMLSWHIDSTSNFMFSNPIYFVTFLTEVINQTFLATKTNKEIDIYQIISDSAGKQMGIPIDFDQLKLLI